jgi:tryptophan synthase alpha subunit
MVKEIEAKFIEKIKQKHIGKWIGMKGSDVVAISDTHEDIYEQLKKKGIDGVYVFYLPTEKEKEYGFLFG